MWCLFLNDSNFEYSMGDIINRLFGLPQEFNFNKVNKDNLH